MLFSVIITVVTSPVTFCNFIFVSAIEHTYLFPGLPCVTLTVEHSNVTALDAEYEEHVTVTCSGGYEISAGVESFVTECLGNRSWSDYHYCNGTCKCLCIIECVFCIYINQLHVLYLGIC